jgi:antitoxin ChpS
MATAKLRTLGGSTVLAIPPALLAQLGLTAGGRLDIVIDGDKLVLRKAERVRPRYTLAELLAQCEPGPFELDHEWLNAPAVGAECGSPEWTAAERDGRLDEFLEGAADTGEETQGARRVASKP